MATYRCLRTGLLVQNTFLTCRNVVSKQVVRTLKKPRTLRPFLTELYFRRLEAGPEPERHPENFGCWNYDAEIFAFGKRFGEEFKEQLLKRAFIFRSYLDKEMKTREDLNIDLDMAELDVQDNTELANKGEELANRYIKAYLRHTYPLMFEEGICAVCEFLMSNETLYHISSNLGFKDLIMSMEYPPEEDKYCTAFKAVIGALAESQGNERAEYFVRDFVLPQLVDKDINELWEVINPMGLLNSLLTALGRGPPEPRLLRHSGSETIMSLYHVGIYSDKELIGESPGESVIIAEEMAAREALKYLMKTSDYRPPLQLGQRADNIQLDYDKKNISIEQLMQSLENKSQHSIADGVS